MQADAEPRNGLEGLALDIFRAHTSQARFNAANSGAEVEWWEKGVIEDTDDIGWHWDKDYGMESAGINVHPCVATVTYLSTNGGPTVVLQKKGPMACEDAHLVEGVATKAWVSRPLIGKHISFDGRYLHAAPSVLALGATTLPRRWGSESQGVNQGGGGILGKDNISGGRGIKWGLNEHLISGDLTEPRHDTEESVNHVNVKQVAGSALDRNRRRVSFLVNVWLNHKPSGVLPLPNATAEALSKARIPLDMNKGGSSSDSVGDAGLVALKIGGPSVNQDKIGIPGGCSTPDAGGASFESAVLGGACNPLATGDKPLATGDESLSTISAPVCCDVDYLRWEFGEVGEKAEEQVHELHEVVVPIPLVAM
ncbi:unnamed protein product, partial [Discosporangium mesarthrocarpum]